MDSADGETAREVSEVFFNAVEQAEEVMRVKIFNDSSEPVLQQAINEWLEAAGPIAISYVLQSESSDGEIGWYLTISIFYTEPDRES